MKIIGIDPSFENTGIVCVDVKNGKGELIKYEEFSPKKITDVKLKELYPDLNNEELKQKSVEAKDNKMQLLINECLLFINEYANEDTHIIIEDLRAFGSYQIFTIGGLITSINNYFVKKFDKDLLKEKNVYYYTPLEWQRCLNLPDKVHREEIKHKSKLDFLTLNNMNVSIVDDMNDDVADAYNICRYHSKVLKGEFIPFTEAKKQSKRELELKRKQKNRDNNKYVLKFQPSFKDMKKEELIDLVLIRQDNPNQFITQFNIPNLTDEKKAKLGTSFNDDDFIKETIKQSNKEQYVEFLNDIIETGYYYSINSKRKFTFSLDQAYQVPLYKLEVIMKSNNLDKVYWKKVKVEK